MLLVNMLTVIQLTVDATGQHVDRHPADSVTVDAASQHVDRHPVYC